MLDPTATIGSQVAEPLRRHLGLTRKQARDRAIDPVAREHGIGLRACPELGDRASLPVDGVPLVVFGRRSACAGPELETPFLHERDPDPGGGALVQRVDHLTQNVVWLAAPVENPLDGFERS
jgi:hypothetical protein